MLVTVDLAPMFGLTESGDAHNGLKDVDVAVSPGARRQRSGNLHMEMAGMSSHFPALAVKRVFLAVMWSVDVDFLQCRHLRPLSLLWQVAIKLASEQVLVL